MPPTQWGSEITFGWELEGTSVKILRWYEPNQQVLEALGAQGQNWNMRTLIDQQQIIDAMLQKKEWLFNGIRWNQFTPRLTAPTYIQTNLKEEANFTTWEVNAVGSPPGLSVDDLFDQQLEPARAAVGDTDARAEVVGFQVHRL